MTDNISLELLLQAWGREYGAGQAQWLGYPKTSTIGRELFTGRGEQRVKSPDLTHGDIVEGAVRRLANAHWREMMVLRMEYTTPRGWTYPTKMAKLRRIGISISRYAYDRALEDARRLLAGEL